jgi:hypothetical protein
MSKENDGKNNLKKSKGFHRRTETKVSLVGNDMEKKIDKANGVFKDLTISDVSIIEVRINLKIRILAEIIL